MFLSFKDNPMMAVFLAVVAVTVIIGMNPQWFSGSSKSVIGSWVDNKGYRITFHENNGMTIIDGANTISGKWEIKKDLLSLYADGFWSAAVNGHCPYNIKKNTLTLSSCNARGLYNRIY